MRAMGHVTLGTSVCAANARSMVLPEALAAAVTVCCLARAAVGGWWLGEGHPLQTTPQNQCEPWVDIGLLRGATDDSYLLGVNPTAEGL